MPNLTWFFRLLLISVLGTGAIATLFASTLAQNDSNQHQGGEETQQTPIAVRELPVYAPPASESSSTPTESSSEATKTLKKKENSETSQAKTQSQETQKKQPEAQKNTEETPPVFDLRQSLVNYSPLFATPVSLGMLAIGAAEGNYRVYMQQGTLYVEQTTFYFGHTDPGNLSWGETVRNYGPCSDQGRSKGNISLAEQICLQRALNRLSTHLVDFNAAGIHPDYDLEGLLNAADLYNQASPIHSRYFPYALAMARDGGKDGLDAIAWARTASFYLNEDGAMDITGGKNKATGLIGICRRERRLVTEWECVYQDQMRRVKAISNVLQKYLKVAQQ